MEWEVGGLLIHCSSDFNFYLITQTHKLVLRTSIYLILQLTRYLHAHLNGSSDL